MHGIDYNGEFIKLGDKITINITREYGPYLDEGKNNLPIGEYEAELFGYDPWSNKPSSFYVDYQGFRYHVLPRDTKEFE